MGILSNILQRIFPSPHPAVTQGQAPAPPSEGAGSMQSAAAQTTAPPAPQAKPAAPMALVDVEGILNDLAASSGQQLNWRSSIVDLLKLLNIDSSLQARKELANELNYKGDTGDSAHMNMWLHRQVMNRLAANGGKVPADLRD